MSIEKTLYSQGNLSKRSRKQALTWFPIWRSSIDIAVKLITKSFPETLDDALLINFTRFDERNIAIIPSGKATEEALADGK